jgi:hypothetical protein
VHKPVARVPSLKECRPRDVTREKSVSLGLHYAQHATACRPYSPILLGSRNRARCALTPAHLIITRAGVILGHREATPGVE